MLGIVAYGREYFYLFLKQKAHRRLGHKVSNPCGRRVGSVGRPEGIVHVHVRQSGELLRKALIVRFLTRFETGVLEQDHAALRHAVDYVLHGLARRVAREAYSFVQQLL